MIKRHFFLVAAAVLLALMVVAVILRISLGGEEKGGDRHVSPVLAHIPASRKRGRRAPIRVEVPK